MRLPFVRRDLYDSAVREAESWREIAQQRGNEIMEHGVTVERLRTASLEANSRALSAEGRYDALAARFDTLLAQFAELRLAGATVPDAVTPLTPREIDPLERALTVASAGKPAHLRAAMRRQFAEDRKAIDAGLKTDTQVLLEIQLGVPTDGMPV